MREMFEEVRSNKVKSYLLVVMFICIIAFLGAVLGLIFLESYAAGFIVALLVSAAYCAIAYSSGDSMVLKATGSRPVTKREYPHLYHAIEGLAIAAGMPKPKAYVIEDTALNAFATGRDPKHASITVTTGLLKKLNRQELEGVIGHEMAHIRNYDTRIMVLAAVLVGVTILISDIMLRSLLWGRAGRRRRGGEGMAVLMIIGLLLAVLAPIAARLIRLAISRRREYAADAGSAILTRYPPGLASALKKISKDPDPLVDKANRATAHLFISTPFRRKRGWLVGLFSTHPPIGDRIRRLKEM